MMNVVTIAGGDVVQNVVLIAGATMLRGTVRLPDGAPAHGVYVCAVQAGAQVEAGRVATGEDGAYAFALAAGTYNVNIQGGYGWGAGNYFRAPRAFTINPILANLDLTTDTERTITLPFVYYQGRTIDNQGQPIAGVTFEVEASWSRNGTAYFFKDWISQNSSDAQGNYQYAFLAGGEYTVKLIPPTGSGVSMVTLEYFVPQADTMYDFVLPSGVLLEGTVRTLQSAPIQNVILEVTDVASDNYLASSWTDQNGHYEFRLPTGHYNLNVLGGKAFGRTPNVPAPQDFRIDPYRRDLALDTDTIFDVVVPIVTLSGRTLDSHDQPVSAVDVQAPFAINQWNVGEQSYSVATSQQIVSDAEGRF